MASDPVNRNPFRPEVLSKIGRLELRARYVAEGVLAGMHRSPYKGFSVEFAGHRAYVPGDDLRHLDWRLYAKSDRLHIKEYEVDTNLRTYLLLDGSQSMAYPQHPGDDRMTKWEYAATAAAALARLLLGQQDAVGLVLFDGHGHETLPPSTRRASLTPLAEAIEARGAAMVVREDARVQGHGLEYQTVPPVDGQVKGRRVSARPEVRGSLSQADEGATGALLGRLADDLPKRSMAIILSDLLTDPDDTIASLRALRHRQLDVLVFHVLDDDELTFPFDDRTRFQGLERSDLTVATDPQSLRKAYLEAMESWLGRLRSSCLDMRIDYTLFSTADPLDAALSRFLAGRMHRLRVKV